MLNTTQRISDVQITDLRFHPQARRMETKMTQVELQPILLILYW